MHYVYALLDLIIGKIYIGRTGDLRKRLKQHQQGKTWSTSRMGNLELIFYEAFKSKQDSIRRERYFKTSKGRSSLRQIIRDSINKVI